jgi:hypothetical protein
MNILAKEEVEKKCREALTAVITEKNVLENITGHYKLQTLGKSKYEIYDNAKENTGVAVSELVSVYGVNDENDKPLVINDRSSININNVYDTIDYLVRKGRISSKKDVEALGRAGKLINYEDYKMVYLNAFFRTCTEGDSCKTVTHKKFTPKPETLVECLSKQPRESAEYLHKNQLKEELKKVVDGLTGVLTPMEKMKENIKTIKCNVKKACESFTNEL